MKTNTGKGIITSKTEETLQHGEVRKEEERKELLRMRNVHQCRKNRKKWKERDDEMNNLYMENEARIHQLETMIDKMSAELGLCSNKISSSACTSSQWLRTIHLSHLALLMKRVLVCLNNSSSVMTHDNNWVLNDHYALAFIHFWSDKFGKQIISTETRSKTVFLSHL